MFLIQGKTQIKTNKVITIEFAKQRFTTFIALFESLGSMIAKSYFSVITEPKIEYKLTKTA